MKQILIVVAIAILIVLGVTVLNKPKTTTTTVSQTSTNTSQDNNTNTKSYTLADISSHNSSSDCYMAISGKVYDVTQYITSHPGGDVILDGCGKDATELFTSEPKHNGRAQSLLSEFEIGILKQS